MATLMPEGDDLRKAVKWIAEERALQPRKKLTELIAEAGLKFDLSPMDADFLQRTLRGEKKSEDK